MNQMTESHEVRQFGWLGLGLGCFGLLYGASKARPFVWLSAGIAALASIFAIAYNTNDSYAYLIPTYLIFAVWLGLGVDRVRTGNDAQNAPILHINESMGYRPIPGGIDFLKDVS